MMTAVNEERKREINQSDKCVRLSMPFYQSVTHTIHIIFTIFNQIGACYYL